MNCSACAMKTPKSMAVANGDIVKLIVAAGAHENAEIVGGQNGIADDVVVEGQVERNARAGIVVQIEFGKD